MLLRLFLLFVGLPLVELAILVQLGKWVGLLPTIGLVVLTGAAGAALARRQGFRAWHAIQGELRQGRMPVGELMDGLLVLIGGIVLLTPGLITDILGLLLLLPPTRRAFKAYLRRRFERMIRSGQVGVITLIR